MPNLIDPKLLEVNMRKALFVLGAQAGGFIKPLIKSRTGNLSNSISWAVCDADGGNTGSTKPIQRPPETNVCRIGSNVVYARIQEFGGVVKARNAGAMTIPLNKEAEQIREQYEHLKDFGGLFIKKNEDGFTFLVKKEGKNLKYMFLLVSQIRIKKQSYMRLGFYTHRNDLNETFKKLVAGAVKRTLEGK